MIEKQSWIVGETMAVTLAGMIIVALSVGVPLVIWKPAWTQSPVITVLSLVALPIWVYFSYKIARREYEDISNGID